MPRGAISAYVPTLGDHWLCTEWSDKRSRLPSHHGTEAEAKRRLYERVRFLTGRGWRVTEQRMSDDATPGKRRMLVRVIPPAEYQHCGESVIGYRSCGGPSWCDLCERVRLSQEEATRIYAPADDDPERVTCSQPDFEHGMCRSCGAALIRHFPRFTREGIAAFWADPVQTSTQTEAIP